VVVFLSATVISCSQAMNVIQRIKNVSGLTESQKTEIIQEVRKTIPSCPIKIIKDDGRNSGR
jgi:hypothetical protein